MVDVKEHELEVVEKTEEKEEIVELSISEFEWVGGGGSPVLSL
jgi:hypothetical protein